MVKENITIPKENKAQVEEVREIENKSQEQEPTITESIKETVLPTVHASDDKKRDDDAKKIALGANAASTGILTAICPPAGAVAGGFQAATGAILKQSDDPQNKEDGEILSDAAAIGGGIGAAASVGEAAAQGVGEAANQVVDTIKKVF